ncbi:MAG: hypothetical protein GY726_02350 [Proteobacteria bacterium]|nr:hypothetical protein [Pseudomonadota bacterium]
MARGKHTTPEYWRNHFAAHKASGLNAASYLRREGIRPSQWYRWRKLLREADNNHSATLVPVKIHPEVNAAQDIRVHLPNGIAVTLPPMESPAQLVQALYRLGSE